MRFPLHLGGVVTGSEIFRVASLCLYITLLLHAVLAAYLRDLLLSDYSIFAAGFLTLLFIVALARYAWPTVMVYGRAPLIAELFIAVFVIVTLTLQQAAPTQPLPWLIGLAGVFPLALEAPLALAVTIAIACIGFTLNLALNIQLVDWLPQVFATVFVGLAAILLTNALSSNLLAAQQARLNERRFHAIARTTRHAFVIADARYRVRFANDALQEVVGYNPEEVVRDGLKPVLHPDDIDAHRSKLRYLRDTPRSSISSRHRTRHKNGHWVWLETSGYNMLHDSAIDGLVFSIEDITARKEAERKLEEEHALMRAVLDHNPSMIYATDAHARFTISNLSFQRRFGLSSEEALRGKTIHDALLPCAQDGEERAVYEVAERHHVQDLQVIRTGVPVEEQEVQGFWDSDARSWYRVSKYPLRDSDAATVGMLCIARDITERKVFEMRLQHQALHDPLTGLPNRRYLVKTIADAISCGAGTASPLAVLACDLDFFKSVNDTHGHDFGDKCLREITRRILAEVSVHDFVARFGGNEFVVLSRVPLTEARRKAESLLHAISQQLKIDDTVVKIQTSIGIALLDSRHNTPSEFLRDADAAMHQAKERGRNRAEVFDPSLQSTATKRAQMDVALRFALERAELKLVYQPKVSMLNGAVKGFELLLRWNNAQYGSIPPVEFIPVAENSGLVVPIGLWVLEQACRQIREWQAMYPAAADFTVAVNVSMRQLLQPSFLDQVTAMLERSGVAPSHLELELTETSAMTNPVQTIENLARLKRLGLRVALDDFGTGYSSLAYLQKLPIDVLKIDKAFVRGLGHRASEAEIVRLILALAHTLRLETVAEGVETREDMLELKKMECYLAQGYMFSPPVAADAAGEMLRNARHFPVA